MRKQPRNKRAWFTGTILILALCGGIAYAYFVWPTPFAYSFDRTERINRFTHGVEARVRNGSYDNPADNNYGDRAPGFAWASLTDNFATLFIRSYCPRWRPIQQTPEPPAPTYTPSEIRRQEANLHKVRDGMTQKQVEHLMGKCKGAYYISHIGGPAIEYWAYPNAEINFSGEKRVYSINGR